MFPIELNSEQVILPLNCITLDPVFLIYKMGTMITHSQGLNDTMNIKVFIAAYLYTGHNHLLSLAWISLLSSRCIQPTWHFPWLFHI